MLELNCQYVFLVAGWSTELRLALHYHLLYRTNICNIIIPGSLGKEKTLEK